MNTQRLYDLQTILDKVDTDLLVLPGGWFCAIDPAVKVYTSVEQHLRRAIGDRTIALGIDGLPQKPWPKDQTAVAVSKDGMIAAARKFAPAPGENIIAATDYLAQEQHRSRIFTRDNRHIYLGVCYDSFGIRHQNLINPAVDIFLDHIHGFFPAGTGNSGEGYFAKHGLAGASKQWSIPVFGAAVFFDRPVPERWPSGVLWNRGKQSTVYWSYDKNGLYGSQYRLPVREGSASITTYDI